MTLQELKFEIMKEKNETNFKLKKIEKEYQDIKREEEELFKRKNFVNGFLILQLLHVVLKRSIVKSRIDNIETKINLLNELEGEVNKRFAILLDARQNQIKINQEYENDLINKILNVRDENNQTLESLILNKAMEFNFNKSQGEVNEA